ncbi:uncharacterized protein KZ484_021657 [Pholidichthys leucotaenia]
MGDKECVPASPGKSTIALLGKKVQLNNIIGNTIMNSEDFVKTSNEFECKEKNSFKIVKAPNFLDEEVDNDQHILDFMALTYPGPNLFLLAIGSENRQEEKVVGQIKYLQDTFGKDINLAVSLPNLETLQNLNHLKKELHIHMTVASENLPRLCKEWCSGHSPFVYKYNIYSEEVIRNTKEALEKNSVSSLCGSAAELSTKELVCDEKRNSHHQQKGQCKHYGPMVPKLQIEPQC